MKKVEFLTIGNVERVCDAYKDITKKYRSVRTEMSKIDSCLTLIHKYWSTNKQTPVALSEVFSLFTNDKGERLFNKPSEVCSYIKAALKGNCHPYMRTTNKKGDVILKVWSTKPVRNTLAVAVKNADGRDTYPLIKVGDAVLTADYPRMLKAFNLNDIVTFIAQNVTLTNAAKEHKDYSFVTEEALFDGCKTAADVDAKVAAMAAAAMGAEETAPVAEETAPMGEETAPVAEETAALGEDPRYREIYNFVKENGIRKTYALIKEWESKGDINSDIAKEFRAFARDAKAA